MSRYLSVGTLVVALTLITAGISTASVLTGTDCACAGDCRGCERCDCTSCADCVCCDFGRGECCTNSDSACCMTQTSCGPVDSRPLDRS